MSEATVDVPKVGRVKKQYLYVAAAGAGGYVLWRYYRASQQAAADAAAAPEPESAGTIGADIGSGSGGYYDPNGDAGIGGTTTVGDVISTDQQWYDKALVALEDAGYDTGAAALALGKYLRTEPLTAKEQDMVKVALAAAGNPPSGAKAIVTDTSPTPSGLTAPQSLRSGGTPTTAAIPLTWNAVSGASSYVVYRGGTQLATVSGTSYTAGSLAASTSYSFTVRAQSSGGTLSPASNTYTGKTAAAATTKPPTTTKPAPPKPKPPAIPPHHSRTISPSLNSLSKLVADDNKKTHKSHSWQSVWSFNLKYRDAATVKKLQARGPNKTYLGSTFWIPNA